MAMDEAPPFWWRKPGWQAILLWPISYVYGRVSSARMAQAPVFEPPVPVICVGNFIVGGAGKTPTVQLIVRHLKRAGYKPGILTRGYGGAISNPVLVDTQRNNARDVGDEALLHASLATTAVSSDRPAGAKLLLEHGCDIIIMDDGFQNPSLHKDVSIAVVDAKRGLGNGFTHPSGPMRVPFKNQLIHADVILVIGDGERGDQIVRKAAKAGKYIFRADVCPVNASRFARRRVLAFSGIADPQKFFTSLANTGANIVEKMPFGDHHVFTEEECADIVKRATAQELMLVTTEKDQKRLIGMGQARATLASMSEVLKIALAPDNPGMCEWLTETAFKRADRRKIAGKQGMST